MKADAFGINVHFMIRHLADVFTNNSNANEKAVEVAPSSVPAAASSAERQSFGKRSKT